MCLDLRVFKERNLFDFFNKGEKCFFNKGISCRDINEVFNLVLFYIENEIDICLIKVILIIFKKYFSYFYVYIF